MLPRIRERTDRYAEATARETHAAATRQRRAEQDQRDLVAAYLGAERIAESEQLARELARGPR